MQFVSATRRVLGPAWPATPTESGSPRWGAAVRWRRLALRVIQAFMDVLVTVYRWPRMIRAALYVDLCDTEHPVSGPLSGGDSSAPSGTFISAESPTESVPSVPSADAGGSSTSNLTPLAEVAEAQEQTDYQRMDEQIRYCPVCYMWFNGPVPWREHFIGKKHNRRIRHTRR